MAWPRTAIDQFILARLEASGLAPAPAASKLELVRRVYFDMTGLPPTPEEAGQFADDTSPDAFEKLVDRLLDSPNYGERWAQHWLDVVRFGETEGFEYDRNIPDAWRYRDYVIESLNRDKPYDRFVLEQLAGDELDPESREMQIAAGFHRLGPVRRNAGNQDVASSRNEVLTDRTDIIGAVFLGLTIGCARCHDHKFDPIRQKDYYQMQAFLAGTDERNIPLSSPQEQEDWKAKIKSINQEIARLKRGLKNADDAEKARLNRKVLELEENLPSPPATIASIQNVPTNRTAIHVLRRGDWESKGERVGMKGPDVLWPEAKRELPPDTEHPKTALARWIADPENPLTARVMANRIWQYHFGQGLVKTPNDFGKNGDRPSHPELLDYLARQFIENGWRMKPIHRMILLSSVYRQSSMVAQSDREPGRDPFHHDTDFSANGTPRFKSVAPRWGKTVTLHSEERLALTPALSPRERESSGSAVGQSGDGEQDFDGGNGLPLLRGEGRGEGKDDAGLHRDLPAREGAASVRTHSGEPGAVDPENRLLWRFNRRRLDAEEIRDAMLSVSGRLNRKAGGPSVLLPVDPELVGQLYKPSQWTVAAKASDHYCRSVYLIAKRNLRLPFMEVFDQPALQTSCGRREASTHAPQALELLNGRISNALAEAFAQRLADEAGPDAAHQIDGAYWLAAGRPPTEQEKQIALEFLRNQPLKEFALAVFNLNSFLYVN
ncbi:MAG: DUF1553 domain-containing protein [Verrucomicrobia bacterium]|nr:DUF1553 domain-containing protein [Verrucomicrobiota bacterium]